MSVIAILLGIILVRLAIVDARTLRLPDVYTIPLIIAGLAFNTYLADGLPHLAIWGAIVGFTLFWAIGTYFFHRKGVEGLGLGDAKLFAAAGAWLGLINLPYVLLLAASGAIGFTFLRGTANRPIAFGPWLAGGFWVIFVWTYVLVPV